MARFRQRFVQDAIDGDEVVVDGNERDPGKPPEQTVAFFLAKLEQRLGALFDPPHAAVVKALGDDVLDGASGGRREDSGRLK